MNDGEDRLIGGEALQHDTVERADTALRPERLADFIGQGGGRANLETFIAAARDRGDAMDHTLLHGPPGLGKTTLAQIVSAELVRRVPRHFRPGDCAGRATLPRC